VIELRGYLNEDGIPCFAKWFDGLNEIAGARIATALARIAEGNFSQVKGVGAGVFECRIDFGPGYRVYFGKDGDRIVILLGGGTKQRQQKDILTAQRYWANYRLRKKQENR